MIKILIINSSFRKILDLVRNVINTFHNNNFISILKNERQNA